MKMIRRRILVMAASATVLACSTSELGGLSVAIELVQLTGSSIRSAPLGRGHGAEDFRFPIQVCS